MPLVGAQVRKEYGLALPELYIEVDRDDPKAVLEGVAVAGLVGILRQLGDLAEFATEVFHGLQEQVMTTASRSHKLSVRVHDIETAIPYLEKILLSQTSHIHFAYTPSSEYHPRIWNEQNHFIYHDLPRFIMDSYEECHDPPRLHLLDKFDSGGPGSCLKRYSDPTFFRRASANKVKDDRHKLQTDRKARKTRRKGPMKQYGEVMHGESTCHPSSSATINSVINGHAQLKSPQLAPPSQTGTTVNVKMKAEPVDHFDSSTGSELVECVFPLTFLQPEEHEYRESPSLKLMQNDKVANTVYPDERAGIEYGEFTNGLTEEQIATYPSCDTSFPDEQAEIECGNFPTSVIKEHIATYPSSVVWDEKAELVYPHTQSTSREEVPEIHEFDLDPLEREVFIILGNYGQDNALSDDGNTLESTSNRNQTDGTESEPENYMDALNTIESESETDVFSQMKQEVDQHTFNKNYEGADETRDLKVEHPSNTNYKGAYKADDLTPRGSDCCPPKLDSYTESHISSDKEMMSDLSNLVSSKDYTPEQILESARKFNSSERIADDMESLKLESVTVDLSVSDSNVYSSRKDPSDELSCSHLDKLWSNGGLLGLQPAKPPDFTTSDAGSEKSLNKRKDKKSTPLNYPSTCNGNDHDQKLSMLNENDHENIQDTSSTYFRVFHDDYKNGTSSVGSFPSSPSLEHMKIFFHPLNRFEASKLKLKFLTGDESQVRIEDEFPSFQLDPEQAITVRDIVSDSEDDTFCRSSPYILDDCSSYHSESSFENWECDKTLEGSSPRNDAESLISGPLLDLPSFDAINPVLQEAESNSDQWNLLYLQCLQEPTPGPPPLPPVQWRDSNIFWDETETPENLKQTIDQKIVKSAPTEKKKTKETIAIRQDNKKELLQSDGQKESNQAREGQGKDDGQDFLQQIREKSFNLKRTVVVKPIGATIQTANVKVTAILEKANAIRQAVGSDDDDDDDSWRDN